jgi:hypothetical protein
LLAGDCTPTGSIVVDLPRATAPSEPVQLLDLGGAVPEPETYLLMLVGLAGIVLALRRRT